MSKRKMGFGDGEEPPIARKKLEYDWGWSQDDVDEFLEQDEAISQDWPVQESSYSRAFGELEFYKRYLIDCLFRCGSRRPDIDELQKMKDVKCEAFDSYLCAVLNAKLQHFPVKNAAPGAEKSMVFSCEVNESGQIIYRRPYYDDERTPLQKAFGDDKVLMVKFCSKDQTKRELYQNIVRNGFDIGCRHFDYFVHKEEKQRRNAKKTNKQYKRSYFICTGSESSRDLSDPHFVKFKSVEACQKHIMHIHTISDGLLCDKRLQLALSKTRTANINLDTVNVEHQKDIPCKHFDGTIAKDVNGKDMIHTDGTGFISEDLARKCALNPGEDYPALLQVRLFYRGMAIKGTLLTLKTLQHGTIVYRDSMLKVKSDPNLQGLPTYNSLEICNTSHKPPVANLSRYVIALLVLGGVPESIFLEAVGEAIAKAVTPLQDISAAYRLCCKFPHGDLARRMILAGIPLTDNFLKNSLMTMIRSQLKRYAKASVPLDGSFYLMGTADPTNTLARNQVAIVLENGPIHKDNVLVYKHPGMHPGDVHVFEATWNEELERHVGRGKYVIIFPTKGARSVVHEIANSDLDGDMYWICTNEKVSMSFKPTEPWQEKRLNKETVPKSISKNRVRLLLKFIFEPNYAIASAATNWINHMDKRLSADDVNEQKFRINRCLELTDMYYVALDADKTGDIVIIEEYLCERSKPHFLVEERDSKDKKSMYYSTSIFGKIFDQVFKVIEVDYTEIAGSPTFYNEFVYGDYQFYKEMWKQRYKDYRFDMRDALDSRVTNQADGVHLHYRQILFGGAMDIRGAAKRPSQIYEESCAIYNVVYEHYVENEQNRWKPSFTFAWKVAGEPLCNLYCDAKSQTTISVSKEVLDVITNVRGASAALRDA